MKQNKNLLF